MTKEPEKREHIVDWEPAPGVLLCKPLKREEMAALYNRDKGKNLALPDRVGKVSDSVGTGQVVKLGSPSKHELEYLQQTIDMQEKKQLDIPEVNRLWETIKPGDYVAWMPFTDQLIEIDGQKYSLVGYDKIRAVRKGSSNAGSTK